MRWFMMVLLTGCAESSGIETDSDVDTDESPGAALTILGVHWISLDVPINVTLTNTENEIVGRGVSEPVHNGEWSVRIDGLQNERHIIYMYVTDGVTCDRQRSWVTEATVAWDTEVVVDANERARDGIPCTHL